MSIVVEGGVKITNQTKRQCKAANQGRGVEVESKRAFSSDKPDKDVMQIIIANDFDFDEARCLAQSLLLCPINGIFIHSRLTAVIGRSRWQIT